MIVVIQGDCVEVSPTLADKSVDASITVPAYALWLAGTWIVALFLLLVWKNFVDNQKGK